MIRPIDLGGVIGYTTAERDALLANYDGRTIWNNQVKELQSWDTSSSQWVKGGAPIVIVASDANATMASTTSLEVLPTITANRTLTLPSAASLSGEKKTIWNKNSAGFTWTFASAVTLPDETTSTAIANDSFITLQSTGTVWVRIDSQATGGAAAPIVDTATNTAYTMGLTTDFQILPTITANRVLTLPSPVSGSGMTKVIWNKNSAAFAWTANPVIKLSNDSTTAALLNDSITMIKSDGADWIRIDPPYALWKDDTIGGNGLSLETALFVDGFRPFNVSDRNALTGMHSGSGTFNTDDSLWSFYNGTTWLDVLPKQNPTTAGTLTLGGPVVEKVSPITFATTTNLDMASDNIQTESLTNNVTITTSNKAAGRSKQVIFNADSTTRTIAFPGGWKWYSAVPPNIPANKFGILSIEAIGPAETDIHATFSPQTN